MNISSRLLCHNNRCCISGIFPKRSTNSQPLLHQLHVPSRCSAIVSLRSEALLITNPMTTFYHKITQIMSIEFSIYVHMKLRQIHLNMQRSFYLLCGRSSAFLCHPLLQPIQYHHNALNILLPPFSASVTHYTHTHIRKHLCALAYV